MISAEQYQVLSRYAAGMTPEEISKHAGLDLADVAETVTRLTSMNRQRAGHLAREYDTAKRNGRLTAAPKSQGGSIEELLDAAELTGVPRLVKAAGRIRSLVGELDAAVREAAREAALRERIEKLRAGLARILAATAEALRLPANGDLNAIPARAAATYDSARNLREQLNRATTGRQQLQEQLDDMTSQRDEVIEARDVLRYQLTTHKATIKGLIEQVATAHNALRTLARAYADAVPGAAEPTVAEQGCDDCSVEPGERHRYTGCPGNEWAATLNGLLANVGRSLISAVDDAERAEAIEMLLDGWYAAWPDSAVTSPSVPLATELVRLLGTRAGETAQDEPKPVRAARRQLDQALTAALPLAGGRVQELLEELRCELTRVDDERALARTEVSA